jgi:hypothetical protein
LYDLETDPHELNNLASSPQHANLLRELRATLETWRRQTADHPPAVLSGDEFDRETGTPLPNRQRPRVPRPSFISSGS